MDYYFRESILTIMFSFINFSFNKFVFNQPSVVTIDREINLIIMTQASKFYKELQKIFLFFYGTLLYQQFQNLKAISIHQYFDDE